MVWRGLFDLLFPFRSGPYFACAWRCRNRRFDNQTHFVRRSAGALIEDVRGLRLEWARPGVWCWASREATKAGDSRGPERWSSFKLLCHYAQLLSQASSARPGPRLRVLHPSFQFESPDKLGGYHYPGEIPSKRRTRVRVALDWSPITQSQT